MASFDEDGATSARVCGDAVRNRSIALVAAAGLFGIAIAGACGGSGSVDGGAGAGGDASGTAGASGAGTGGATTGGSAGSAGSAGWSPAGSGGTAGSAGADAGTIEVEWETLGEVIGCTIERAANAAELKPVFEWAETSDGRERTVIDSARWFPPGSLNPGAGSFRVVQEPAGEPMVVFGVAGGSAPRMQLVVVAGENGAVLDVVRAPEGDRCTIGFPALANGTLGVELNERKESTGPITYGSLVVRVGEPKSAELRAFQPLSNSAVLGLTQDRNDALGDQYWLGQTTALRIFAMQRSTGAITVLTEPEPTVVSRAWPEYSGSRFFYSETRQVSSTGDLESDYRNSIWTTSATGPPEKWYEPIAGGAGSARDAHSHIGFLVGNSPSWIGSYTRVEVWAAGREAPPGSVQPTRLGEITIPDGGVSLIELGWDATAGHGFYLVADGVKDSEIHGYSIWNLEGGAHVHHDIATPEGLSTVAGVTKTHAYVTITEPPFRQAFVLERVKVPQ